MKPCTFVTRLSATCVALSFFSIAGPRVTYADEFNDILLTVEAEYGPIAEPNMAQQGGVDWLVRDLVIRAKKMYQAGDSADALQTIKTAAQLAKLK